MILVVISIFSLNQYFFSEANSPFWLAIFYNNFAPLWYLAGPLLLWYTRSLIKDEIRFYRIDILHLVPFLIHFIGILPYLISPFDHKLSVAQQLLQDASNLKSIRSNWLVPLEVNLVARPLLLIAYSCASIFLFHRHVTDRLRNKTVFSETHGGQVRRWFYVFTGIMLIISVNYLIAGYQFIQFTLPGRSFYTLPMALTNSFLIGLLPVMLVIFPEVIYGLPRNKRKTEQATSEVKSEKTETLNENDYFLQIRQQIEEFMEREKPYLNPDFSVEDLSRLIHVPRHHIYYCLNNVIGKKFTTLKTTCRVEYAKKLLLGSDLERFTIDSIGQQSGFASRSSFYSAFREITGYTPTEFLQQSGRIG